MAKIPHESPWLGVSLLTQGNTDDYLSMAAWKPLEMKFSKEGTWLRGRGVAQCGKTELLICNNLSVSEAWSTIVDPGINLGMLQHIACFGWLLR